MRLPLFGISSRSNFSPLARLPGIRSIPITVRGHHTNIWFMTDAVALKVRLIGVAVFLVCAAVVTLASLYFMHTLIQSGDPVTEIDPDVRLVDFVHADRSRELNLKRREPEPLPMPETPPRVKPPVEHLASNSALGEGWSWEARRPSLELESESLFGANLTLHSGEYLPIVKVEPIYPRQAVARSIEGWVLVEFTVTELGNVINPVIIANCAHSMLDPGPCNNRPAPIFDEAALRAAEKFRYKPRIVDGEPIAVAGVQNKIFFELLPQDR